jgi:hypothetical protein
MTEKSETYYLKRKMRFLLEFDLVAKSARSVLKAHFGENASELITQARHEFENLIPQLPYIGGKQPFTEFIVFTAMFLAVYRIYKTQGKTVKETGGLLFEIGREFLHSYPAILLYKFGRMNFSKRHFDRLRKRAIKSHQRKYPDGYVFDFIEGDGKTFDYGVDYLECASCKFLAKQGAPELAPYLCPVDILYSEVLGWGLTRTMTLAEGAEKCDFRFKRGGETNIRVPPVLRDIVSQT